MFRGGGAAPAGSATISFPLVKPNDPCTRTLRQWGVSRKIGSFPFPWRSRWVTAENPRSLSKSVSSKSLVKLNDFRCSDSASRARPFGPPLPPTSLCNYRVRTLDSTRDFTLAPIRSRYNGIAHLARFVSNIFRSDPFPSYGVAETK